jgi:hypothetical protein
VPHPPPCYVLVADLVASRRAPARRTLGRRLEDVLAACAREFAWRAPLMSTRGLDELSGVLAAPAPAFDVCAWLNEALWPQRFRFALACGGIDVAPDSTAAADMDGPAFHLAADALARARAADLPFAVNLPGRDGAACALIEALGTLHGAMTAQWTPGAARAMLALRQAGTQREAAKALGITQQAISRALRRARQHELDAARTAVRTWLATLEGT